MVGQPLTIPPPSDDDHEDVAWALRAASAQWRRDDRQDALAWVRRAAETAIEVGQAIRARELFILAQRLEQGPSFGSSQSSAPPPLPVPAARLAVAPPMRAPAVPVVPAAPLSVDDAELEFDDPDALDDEEILFEEEVETVAELPTEVPPPSGRSGVSLPSAFPSSLPSRAKSPSLTPPGVRELGGGRLPSYPASVPPNPWARPSSSRPPPSSQVPSLPPLPSVPAPRLGSGPPSSGSRGFDTAFLDSLDDEGPVRGRDSDPDFGEEPPTHHLGQGARNTAVDLPLRAMRATSSLPIDAATAAEYAQRSRGRPLETHEDIEQELGVDLSVGRARPAVRAPEPERRAAQRDLSPTPGRASVRPSTSSGRIPSALSEPFALAPSASLPPVRMDPFVRPSFAPPPESMSEPERHDSRQPEPELDLAGQVGRRQSSLPPPILPPVDDDDDILAGAFERIQSRPPPAVAQALAARQAVSPPGSMAPGPASDRASSGPASSGPASSSRGSLGAAPAPPATPLHQLDGIELLEVRGLQDLPEDAMSELVGRARVVALGPGEEVASFGVALVSAGSVLLMPTVADASCARARQGEVVFTRGTVQSSVALRVVAAEPSTRVAVLSDADLDAVTSSCPWVRAELAEVGDRFNAFGGAVLGPLGESLDEMFRTMVLDKCVVKNPPPGTLIAYRGKPMDGMYVLGAGSLLVLGEDGRVESELSPGAIVFPETVLSASPARADIRVAKAGALLLYAGRMAAHELLATCPPFIEILAS